MGTFEGYIVLENKLNSINLDGLLSYKYTFSSSSFSDNTPETHRVEEETKPKKNNHKTRRKKEKENYDI